MKVFWGLTYFPLSSIYPQHAVRAVNVKTVTIITVGILFFPSFAFCISRKKGRKKEVSETIRFVDREWTEIDVLSLNQCTVATLLNGLG